MAALDPKYEFTFSLGAPTAGNLNAAAGTPILTVAAVHYLQVASGNTLPPAPGGANRFAVPWPQVDVAMLKVHTLNAAVHGTQSAARITNLRACHDAFQRAEAGGLTFDNLGSLEAALARFVQVSRPLAMQSPAAWELGPAQFQALPPPPAAFAALPVEAEWFMHLEFSMGATASGAPLALVAIRAVLSGWCSHVSRALPAFQDAASEFYDMVGESRGAAWLALTPRRQALAISAHVSHRLQSVELLLPVPAVRSFATASLYRLSRVEAFPSFFEEGWRSAYRALALLFVATCDGAEALRLVGRLLAAAPSPDPTSSLDARVRLLLPHLDTAVLRGAPASDRTTAMEALLKSGSAPSVGSSHGDGTSASGPQDDKDPVMWGRVFAQAQSRALFLLLDPLNVTPLVEYRVARVLLSDPSPIGIHVIAKGVKVPSQLFRSLKAGFSQAAALLALQRTMCVDPSNTLRLDWFPAFEATSMAKLITGKWVIGPSSSTAMDVWGELVGKLYLFQKGPFSLSHLNAFSPTGFFSDEFALRVGSPIITAVWGFIGVAGPATLLGSVAWVLQELHQRAEKVACWTQAFADTRLACQALLQQAGARAFADAGVAWNLMLEAPVELAVKPVLLCPPTNGFHSILARCDAIVARTEVEIQI